MFQINASYPVALSLQTIHQVVAYESSCTGNQDSRCLLHLILPLTTEHKSLTKKSPKCYATLSITSTKCFNSFSIANSLAVAAARALIWATRPESCDSSRKRVTSPTGSSGSATTPHP